MQGRDFKGKIKNEMQRDFNILFLIFREWRREGEREGEKHRRVREHWLVASHTCPRGLNLQPGMCPDWELNQQPFTFWDDARASEPHWPGL